MHRFALDAGQRHRYSELADDAAGLRRCVPHRRMRASVDRGCREGLDRTEVVIPMVSLEGGVCVSKMSTQNCFASYIQPAILGSISSRSRTLHMRCFGGVAPSVTSGEIRRCSGDRTRRGRRGDLTACLYCVAPGCIVHSCGHRRLRPSESNFRVLAHPCDKCELKEHAHLILDAVDDSAAAAVRILDDSPLYALFCGKAAETVEWWDEIFPLSR